MGFSIDQIKESYGRANVKGNLFDRFYDIFLASHPDIAPRFANTDFEKQKGLIRQGINLAIMFADDNTIGRSGMARIRESHSKAKLDVPPKMYKYWLDSFVQTISELDEKFTPDLKAQWKEAMQKVTDYIAEGYDEAGQSDKNVA